MSKSYIFKVEGMSCSHCERAVSEAVKPIAGVSSVTASAAKKLVIVKGSGVDTAAVSAAITDTGYEVKGVEEKDSDDGDGSRAR
ncbi:MAG: heavy-metal-associated domain-containing protein [Spirochaetota bacterium]